jgi:hypothetical protein
LVLECAGSESINCYTCSSFNGSDTNCEDPYNPAMSTYTEKCMVPKQGHIGTFPANFCIKIVGKNGKFSLGYPLLNRSTSFNDILSTTNLIWPGFEHRAVQ